MKSLKTIFDQVSLHVFLLLNLSQSVPTRGPKKLGQFVGNLLYMFAYFWKLLLFKQSQPKLWACRTSTIAKTKKPVHSWNPTFLFTNPYIRAILVGKTMRHHNSQTIRDLDISNSYHLVLICCYTLCGWNFCFCQPLLVMHSRGEPLLTTLKLVTVLIV